MHGMNKLIHHAVAMGYHSAPPTPGKKRHRKRADAKDYHFADNGFGNRPKEYEWRCLWEAARGMTATTEFTPYATR